MDFEHITTGGQLRSYCKRLAHYESIALDTEFVSEHTFRPVLCLIQVATPDRLALVDPLQIDDLAPFWNVLAAEERRTIVHAGRGEVEFCLAATGKPPAGLFDVQLAAGLIGIEYPIGYNNLITKVLGHRLRKHETRTDWRRRPLTQRQIDYALEDVIYLHDLAERLDQQIRAFGRSKWLEEEMTCWTEDAVKAASEERWRRVSGNTGLSARELAIVRELYFWREAEAERRNQPVRRILRDDLIVELARRQSADPQHIRTLRGMERGDLKRLIAEIAASIDRALHLPEKQCPHRILREPTPQLSVLGQFLFAALGSVCREAQLAPNLVGTPNDIRDLLSYRSGQRKAAPAPKLARGWRKQFVGDLFEDLMAGRTAIRIKDADSDYPLAFEPREP